MRRKGGPPLLLIESVARVKGERVIIKAEKMISGDVLIGRLGGTREYYNPKAIASTKILNEDRGTTWSLQSRALSGEAIDNI